MVSKKNLKLFKSIYFQPSKLGSFTGIQQFLSAVQKRTKSKVVLEQAKDWIKSVNSYTLFRPAVKKFKRRKVIVSGIDAVWGLDLSILPSRYSRANNGYTAICFCIDIFSRFLFARMLKDKSGESVLIAFKDIIEKSSRKPGAIWVDKGTEWNNRKFRAYLKAQKIEYYTIQDDNIKSSFAERVQRTIKLRIARFLNHSNSLKFADKLQAFVDSYNKTPHRALGISPVSVNEENQAKIWVKQHIPDEPYQPPILPTLKPGDFVRISKNKAVFQKGYEPNWSDEIFEVTEVIYSSPPVYKIKDLDGERIKGSFYQHELQLIDQSKHIYEIESILGKRKSGKKTQYLVKWKNWPDKFNSYVTKQDMVSKYKN